MEYPPVSEGVAANAQPEERLVGAETVKQCPRALHLQVVAAEPKPKEGLIYLQTFGKILSTLREEEEGGKSMGGDREGGGLCVCVCVCVCVHACICV